jgi:signal transduction histidine kinase
MGLSIARGIVEAHGGRIWIEDGAGGKGARVSFTVPVGDDEAEMSDKL